MQALSAATSSNYEGKNTHMKVRSVALLNHEKIQPHSASSFSREPTALERVIDCVTVTGKRGTSHNRVSAPQN